jgi:FdhD protein
MSENESLHNTLTTAEGYCFIADHFEARQEDVCIEKVFHIKLNDKPIASLVASPSMLAELGAGFVISEGLCEEIHDVRVAENVIQVYAPHGRESGDYITESSGGVSTRKAHSKIQSWLTIDSAVVFSVIKEIASELWEKTGGAHCSVLFSHNKLIAKCSDVGRHNTVDKVIGFAVLNKVDLSSCVLGCTGRQPAGMVAKAINAGIPIIISKAATTDEGIALADSAGLTLICRVKGDRFCVYTHPRRVIDIR